MVAPVVIPHSPSGWNFGSNSKSKRRMIVAKVTSDSKIANWSPMHFLCPPPKGKYAKSSVYSSGVFPSTGNRSGMNSSGLSHNLGFRCKFHTEMKKSVPSAMS